MATRYSVPTEASFAAVELDNHLLRNYALGYGSAVTLSLLLDGAILSRGEKHVHIDPATRTRELEFARLVSGYVGKEITKIGVLAENIGAVVLDLQNIPDLSDEEIAKLRDFCVDLSRATAPSLSALV